MIEKVRDPVFKRYIDDGFVRSLSTFFCIPKGGQDIRIVYDTTKCGLNACLWSPRFYMSTPDSVFDSIEYEYWMGDIDQGEMFLNYPVDPQLLQYLGVDVTEIVKGAEFYSGKSRVRFRWTRWPMGVRQSPFATTRMFSLSMESTFGNQKGPTYIFGWSHTKLNLPGSRDYKPAEPWVSKKNIIG